MLCAMRTALPGEPARLTSYPSRCTRTGREGYTHVVGLWQGHGRGKDRAPRLHISSSRETWDLQTNLEDSSLFHDF